ncbi:unnamed protein product, partial [Phaeothamnion confervicola]
RVDLLLAVPRPLQLERILAVVSQMGVGTLVLANASKVSPDYFGSHLLQRPELVRRKLVEGLTQSGDSALPRVVVAKRLKIFLEDDLEKLFPSDTYVRVFAHPSRAAPNVDPGVASIVLAAGDMHAPSGIRMEAAAAGGQRLRDIGLPQGVGPGQARVLVAVGPEGGWDEPYELDLLGRCGFRAVTLGVRVLRSDVAVTALLALAHDWVDALGANGGGGEGMQDIDGSEK